MKYIRLTLLMMVLSLLGQLSLTPQAITAQADGASLYSELSTIEESEGADAAAAAYAQLSAAEQEAVNQYMSGAKVIEELVIEPGDSMSAAAGCWSATYGKISKSVTGQTFWRYRQYTWWCSSNGQTLTAKTCDAWAEDVGFGWSFEGHASYCQTTYGGIGWNVATHTSQGRFKACWGGPCPVSANPTLNQQFDNYGGYQAW